MDKNSLGTSIDGLAPIKIQVAFDSCILFLGKIKNQYILDVINKEYCALTMQIIVGKEAFCSESILASRNTNLVEALKIERDRFGHPLDPLLEKMTIDPAKFIDLS